MLTILFVCTNGSGRAPLAAGLLKKVLSECSSTEEFHIDSAGAFAGSSDRAVDRRAIAVAAKHGIDISMARTREVSEEDIHAFDRIIVLDEDSYLHLRSFAAAKGKKSLWLFRDVFGDLSLKEIPDPVIGQASFDEVFKMLERGVRVLAARLRNA